jgi:DNA-binding Xre family transcriptional regulator
MINRWGQMICSESKYKEALERLRQDEEIIALQKEKLEGLGLSEEEVRRALEPMLSFCAQLEEEVEWYEKVRRRDFGIIRDLGAVGTLLIALRIANGLSRRELAERLGVSEEQVSCDERNEYHGITVDQAQRVLDAMGETLTSHVEDKPLALA